MSLRLRPLCLHQGARDVIASTLRANSRTRARRLHRVVTLTLLVFGDGIKGYFSPPKLRVRILRQQGVIAFSGDRQHKFRYHHLLVTNERRWRQATNVRVHITNVERPAPDGSWQRDVGLPGPIPLKWQFGDTGRSYYSPNVPPQRICDFGFVLEGSGYTRAAEFFPVTFPAVMNTAGKMRVTVRAVAEEIESPPLIVEVHWDGQWHDGDAEMARHLQVREVLGA